MEIISYSMLLFHQKIKPYLAISSSWDMQKAIASSKWKTAQQLYCYKYASIYKNSIQNMLCTLRPDDKNKYQLT